MLEDEYALIDNRIRDVLFRIDEKIRDQNSISKSLSRKRYALNKRLRNQTLQYEATGRRKTTLAKKNGCKLEGEQETM